MSTAPLELTAAQAIAAIEAGDLSAGELWNVYAERIERHDPDIGAFLWTADSPPESVPGAPLAGVPLAVKDLFCTEGVPTTAGSRILEGHLPLYTATAVRKLTQAGAAMIGKTNMDEFAMGSSNENSGYGPVRNPWDRERVPGGSKGCRTPQFWAPSDSPGGRLLQTGKPKKTLTLQGLAAFFSPAPT